MVVGAGPGGAFRVGDEPGGVVRVGGDQCPHDADERGGLQLKALNEASKLPV